MCVPIAAMTEGSGEVQVLELAAASMATIEHHGSYENMGESYATLVTWIQEHGHHILGPAHEVYMNSPAEVSESELLTEIQFPIDGQEEA